MKGWLVTAFGQAEWRADVPEPIAQGDEVLLEVVAAAPNFADRLVIDGRYQERPEPPFTPGIEVAGRVDGSGPLMVGLTAFGAGAWAERALCLPSRLCAVPAGLDPAAALAVHANAQTAWFALHRRAAARAGEVVLVHAAAGGVGSMAVQLAALHGCRVIATSSASKRELCMQLGAELWFDNRDRGWRDAVRDAVGSVDVVIDMVGGRVFADSFRLLAFEGRIVSVGFTSGARPRLPVNHALVKNVSLHGLYWTRYLDADPAAVAVAAAEIFGLLAAGRLDPLITRRAGFADALSCVDAIVGGTTTGKTILTW